MLRYLCYSILLNQLIMNVKLQLLEYIEHYAKSGFSYLSLKLLLL